MLQVKNVKFGEGQPKICVPLVGRTKEELIEQATKANASGADVVEWRVDYFEAVTQTEFVIETLLALREILKDKLLLFTFRTLAEGGEQELSLTAYKELCLAVAATKVIDLIDIELVQVEYLGREFIANLKANNVKIIMSSHDFEKTPNDATLVFRVNVMNQLGADIGKLAMMPQQLTDVLRIMGIVSKVRGFNQLPLAVMAMADLGKVTRISGELIGSVLTFGSLEQASAPGQIPVEQLKETLDILKLEK